MIKNKVPAEVNGIETKVALRMNKGSELIDILLKKHNLDYDDLHDVRTLANILADMVPVWKNVDCLSRRTQRPLLLSCFR